MNIKLLCFIMSLFSALCSQTKEIKMKMNAGIITEKLEESKQFYTNVLDFKVAFENDFYLLLHTADDRYAMSFLKPNHPSQAEIFQPIFGGSGVYLTIEVEDVDVVYKRIKTKNVEIKVELRDEVWGDRHFAIMDPNGVGIDIVTYRAPEN